MGQRDDDVGRKVEYMSLFKTYKREIEWAGRPLSIETGKIGKQADASVIVTYGQTMVHCAVCAAREVPETFEEDRKSVV